MHAIPLDPEIVNRLALENCSNDERESPDNDEDCRRPENALDLSRGKDTHVEEDDGQLDQRYLQEVQPSHDVEVKEDIGDLLRRQRPNVPSQSVRGGSMDCDNGARHGCDQRRHHEPVIPADVESREKDLVSESAQNADRRKNGHDVGEDDIFAGSVAHGSAAICQARIFRGCDKFE